MKTEKEIITNQYVGFDLEKTLYVSWDILEFFLIKLSIKNKVNKIAQKKKEIEDVLEN